MSLARSATSTSFALGLTAIFASSPAQADDGGALVWKDDWPRVRPAEYVATGLLTAGLVAALALPQAEGTWKGGVLFDDPLRDGLRLESADNRQLVRNIGDGFYWGLMLYPAVVDIGLLSLVAHQSPDVAWQLVWIDGQSLLWSGLLATLTERIGRDRPFVPSCAEDPDLDRECSSPAERSRSFISGHLTMAATGASLTCTHALHLGLYGGPESAALVCSTAFAGVAIAATSRLLADRHYATDLAGAAMVGVTSGMVLPQLMHFGWDVDPKGGGAAVVTPWVESDAFGLSVSWQSGAGAAKP